MSDLSRVWLCEEWVGGVCMSRRREMRNRRERVEEEGERGGGEGGGEQGIVCCFCL